MNELWLAALSGAIAASTLLIGAGAAWLVRVPPGLVAGIMAFGAGVLISAFAYELVEEAAADGGLWPTVLGCVTGAVIFVVADWLLSRAGGGNRKRANGQLPKREAGSDSGGSAGSGAGAGGSAGTAIAVGALIDGVPESIVLGLSVSSGGGGLSVPIIAAIAISNIPEGLSSTAGLKSDGRSARYVFTLWGAIALASTAAALIGYLLFTGAGSGWTAFVTTVAAGGILAMVSNTMIPEAFNRDRVLTGLYATLGFLVAFALHQIG